jgi:cytochrome c5
MAEVKPAAHGRPSGVMLIALGALAALAAAIAYYGTRGGALVSTGESAPAEAQGPVMSMSLPHYEADLPAGPHRPLVQSACNLCHSAQLILNQPHFPMKKWEETIHKMVANYGAPLSESEQKEILEYLAVIRGMP